MARTKKTSKKATNPPSEWPPRQRATNRQTTVENGSDDEQTGGVSLDSDVQLTQEMMAMYHQPKAIALDRLANDDSLWQPPPAPDNGPASTIPPEMGKPEMHTIPKFYLEIRRVFRSAWGKTLLEVVPEEMRKFTPYSFALLLAIRRVASHSKQHPEIGHEVLFEAWQDRMHSQLLNPFSGDNIGLQVSTLAVELLEPRTESHIQETNYGLTLADAAEARRRVVGLMNRRTNQVEMQRTKREKKAEEKMARKAERVANKDGGITKTTAAKTPKQKRKESDKMREKLVGPKGDKLLRFLQEESGVVLDLDSGDYVNTTMPTKAGAVPPNSPEMMTDSAFLNVPARAPTSNAFDALMDAPDLTENAPEQSGKPTQSDKLPSKINRKDNHHAEQLSNMFRKVNFEDEEPNGKKKLKKSREKKLIEGGASGNSSRRYDQLTEARKRRFANMPTLYARVGEKNMDDALEGLGKMVIEQEQEQQEPGGEEGGGVRLSLGDGNGNGNGVAAAEMDDEEL